MAATDESTWNSSVDLPMPGGPNNKVTEPPTTPPAKTRSTSLTPVGNGCAPSVGTARKGTARAVLAVAVGVEAGTGPKVFHSPQDGQRPTQRGKVVSQAAHTYTAARARWVEVMWARYGWVVTATRCHARCVQTPSALDRAAWAGRGGDTEFHDELLGSLACLHETEGRPPANGRDPRGWVRVVTWNVQRGRRPTELAALLEGCDPGIALLSELDSGMARTDNDDIPDVLAGALGAGYAFGVEFVELGLGDLLEQREAAGQENSRGLHGNAVVSPAEVVDPAVVRLPGDGWFADPSQPRVGGRMAVLATVTIDGMAVQVASTHLENRTDAGHRAEQMEVLLRAVEERAEGGPAIVGGDFNTLGAGFEELFDRTRQRVLRATEPTRFTWPVAHEPLFEVAAAHGFAWNDANVAAPTTEHDARGLPDHVPLKLDWLLVRGLEARRPTVVPVGHLSDHRAVACSVRVPG